jgi:hypothetical protein
MFLFIYVAGKMPWQFPEMPDFRNCLRHIYQELRLQMINVLFSTVLHATVRASPAASVHPKEAPLVATVPQGKQKEIHHLLQGSQTRDPRAACLPHFLIGLQMQNHSS